MRRVRALRSCLAACALLVAACSAPTPTSPASTGSAGQSPGPGGSPASETRAPGTPGSAADLLAAIERLDQDPAFRVPWPVVLPDGEPTVVVRYDDPATTATALVGPDGGTVSAVGSDGTTYALTIPKDALLLATDITLRPLTGIDGVVVKPSTAFGVDFAPHGLQLMAPATLEIVPADRIVRRHAEAVAYDGAGSNLHRLALDPDPDHLRVSVEHFSGVEVYRSEVDAIPVIEEGVPDPVPDTWEALAEEVARGLSEVRDRILAGEEDATTSPEQQARLDQGWQAVWQREFGPALQRMTTDCAYTKATVWWSRAWQTIRNAELLGASPDAAIEKAIDERMGAAIANCYREFFSDCMRYDPVQLGEMLGWVRQQALLGNEDEPVPTMPPCGNVMGHLGWVVKSTIPEESGRNEEAGDLWLTMQLGPFGPHPWREPAVEIAMAEDRGSRWTATVHHEAFIGTEDYCSDNWSGSGPVAGSLGLDEYNGSAEQKNNIMLIVSPDEGRITVWFETGEFGGTVTCPTSFKVSVPLPQWGDFDDAGTVGVLSPDGLGALFNHADPAFGNGTLEIVGVIWLDVGGSTPISKAFGLP